MIAILLILLSTYSLPLDLNPGIKIIEKNNVSLKINLTFLESEKEKVFSRFILSKAPPAFSFSILESDTIFTGNIKNNDVNLVRVGNPIKFKSYNLYPIIVKPVLRNKEIEIYCKEIQLNIEFDNYENFNIPLSLGSVYKNLILNYTYNPAAKPQGLLIITPNSFYDAVLPLADWKERKGWTVTVAKLSETGNTPIAIKNYITNAYFNWETQPEYVILVGDKDSLPSFTIATNPTDHPYTTIEGSDFFSDLLIGRLSVANVNELNTVVAKILGYEKTPYTTETGWFKRALMVGANYPSGMTTPLPTKRWVQEKMLGYWFSQVDTVYYPPTSNGVTPITNSVNQGVTFINYRGGIASWAGWDYPSFYNADVIGLANGWKLPIITSIVCLTGNFNAEPCFGEVWLRQGNPVTPKGAVGFFGASPPTTHSRWNNCLDYGIYWGLLEDSIFYFGPMTYRGKMEVYLNFPLETSPDSGSEFYFNAYNILGDPSLEVWTDVPENFIVNHSSSIPVGTNSFSVQVLDGSSQPVKGALVSLYKKNETKEVEFSDASGMANFQISTSTVDTLFVTVTKHNFKPYCGYTLVNNSTVYVGYYSHIISDPAGNNNGEINPGEPIQLAVTLKNYGTSTTANNVSAKVTSSDLLVTITDSLKSYGNIAPGATASSATPFIFNVSANAKNSHLIKFNLNITSAQGNWSSVLWLETKAPEFSYQRNQIFDAGNGVLEPGETSDLIISIENIGGLIGININGILRSKNPGVTIIDSIGFFGNIPIGDSATNSSNYFRVSASSLLAPGHQINFSTLLAGDNNFKDTIDFSIIIGVVNTNTPLGPDGYGYYAYDNTDAAYAEAPVYNWVEIDPALGGSGTIINLLNDETKTVNMPFSFKYYGTNYNKISISSNGYLSMDSTWIADMYNWHIPSSLGPPCLIAPFWDDLDPNATDSSGNVCYMYDNTNHRFIVEYSRIQHLHDPTNPTPAELQTFEVILLDPTYYPTQTGDGEIIFQYKKINNDDHWHNYATVGIEDDGHINGLEYTYANIYPPAAASLVNLRAIKWTTDQPDPFPGVTESEKLKVKSEKLRLEVYPNPFSQSIRFTIQDARYRIQENQMQDARSNPSATLGTGKQDFSLKIYDAGGRLVKVFNHLSASLTGSGRTGGNYQFNEVVWFGDDDSGRALPAGVYFVQLEIGNFREIEKVIFLR